ncbi:hypothetical protein T459_24002 [Capsicum annuum]|uniref:Reverse transcriptase Ty1/copia-type domain-containing protein n=1 Tax=Capsicum annuum TaxID=4072 RepID=A0A2G2YTW1_CAPAN|nr:hypothetical protein T459_24002 [Capsicum annuum]
MDGTIDKYKVRLEVKGFKQKEGLDYFDTYSQVTRIPSIQMLIALAAVYGLKIHQMDMKTTFLNRELEEEIYMEQPEGFVVSGKENKVCKFIKSLYGLKQAPKQWHAKFDQIMFANGFKINECDKCVYIKDTPNHQVIVCLYVDDMLIISRDISDINATKRMLESKFDMKDLGVSDVILGRRIHRNLQGLALSQSHCIENVLDKFKYIEFSIAKTLLNVSFVLRKNEGNASLISQLVACGTVKKKFAHCLDGVKEGGIFAIGQVVELKVNSVPMIPEQVHYSIPLDHIEVGGQVLNILDSKDESKTIQEGIIDSGITLTWVPRKVYKAIKNKLMERQPHLKFQKDVLAHDCFKYGGKVDDGFPAVTFKFKGNLALAAYPHDYLIEDVI